MNHKFSFSAWQVNSYFLLFCILMPILYVFLHLFWGESEAWQHIVDNLLWDYCVSTLKITVSVAFLSLCMGIPTAWLVSTTEFPFRKHFEWLLVLPLSIPAYILAYTYSVLFSYTGSVQEGMRWAFGTSWQIPIMSLEGGAWIMALALYPYIFTIARSSFVRQSQGVLEAARLLGCSHSESFFRIALPLARPAIAGGLFLVLMETLNEYGTFKHFGIITFTTGIFKAWFSMSDIGAAIRLAACLMLFVFGLMSIEKWERRRVRFVSSKANSERPLQRKKLGFIGKIIAFLFCGGIFMCAFGIPILQMLVWSWQSEFSIFTVEFWDLLRHTLSMALIAALLIVGVSLWIHYTLRLFPHQNIKILAHAASMGYAVPGAVIAVGIMASILGFDKWYAAISGNGFLITGTTVALLWGYLVRFMAVAYSPIESGLQKINTHIDEAAMLTGQKAWKRLWTVILPILRPSLWTAFMLVLVDVIKELPLTLILRPFNYDTLATKAYEAADSEMITHTASVALVIVGVGLLPVLLMNQLMQKTENKH